MKGQLRKTPPLKQVLKNDPSVSDSNAGSPNLWAALALAVSFWVQAALTQTLILFAKFIPLFIHSAYTYAGPPTRRAQGARTILLERPPPPPHVSLHLPKPPGKHWPTGPARLGTGIRPTRAAHAYLWRENPSDSIRPEGRPPVLPEPSRWQHYGKTPPLPPPRPPVSAAARACPAHFGEPLPPIGPPGRSVPRT